MALIYVGIKYDTFSKKKKTPTNQYKQLLSRGCKDSFHCHLCDPTP